MKYYNVKEIAERLGISKSSLHEKLKGVNSRGNNRPMPLQEKILLEKTLKDILNETLKKIKEL